MSSKFILNISFQFHKKSLISVVYLLEQVSKSYRYFKTNILYSYTLYKTPTLVDFLTVYRKYQVLLSKSLLFLILSFLLLVYDYRSLYFFISSESRLDTLETRKDKRVIAEETVTPNEYLLDPSWRYRGYPRCDNR